MTEGKALSVPKSSVTVVFLVLAVFVLKPSPAGLADRPLPISLHDFMGIEPETLEAELGEFYGTPLPKRLAWQAAVTLPSEWGNGCIYGTPDVLPEVPWSTTSANEANKSKAKGAIVDTVAEILSSVSAAVADAVKHGAASAPSSQSKG